MEKATFTLSDKRVNETLVLKCIANLALYGAKVNVTAKPYGQGFTTFELAVEVDDKKFNKVISNVFGV